MNVETAGAGSLTHQVADGMHSAIIRAVKPAAAS